jgi:cytochrome c
MLAVVLATPAFATDPSEGEEAFRKCKSCHSIIAPDGTEIQKGGKTGPNLWGVVGRPVAANPDFKYGAGILAAKAKGAVWDEAQIVTYLADPNAWVKAAAGDETAKSKMTFKLPDAEDAANLAAYLATVR